MGAFHAPPPIYIVKKALGGVFPCVELNANVFITVSETETLVNEMLKCARYRTVIRADNVF
jgi:hypothetical protein